MFLFEKKFMFQLNVSNSASFSFYLLASSRYTHNLRRYNLQYNLVKYCLSLPVFGTQKYNALSTAAKLWASSFVYPTHELKCFVCLSI